MASNTPVSAQADEALLRRARQVLPAYGIDPRAEVIPIRLTNNAVFEVRRTSAGLERLALRLHRPGFRTPDQTRSELQFLAALHGWLAGTHITVPRPVRALDSDLVVELAPTGDTAATRWRHADLLTWVDGRVLRPGRGLGLRAAYVLGEALAQIHRAADEFSPPPGFTLPRWGEDAFFTSSSPFEPGAIEDHLGPDERHIFEVVVDRTRHALDELERRGPDEGVIHADFIPGNLLFSRRRSGWTVAIIDFDDLGWGHRLYDLCPLLGHFIDAPSYAALRCALLEGYRSVRPLRAEFERHLPVLMAARHAAACAWVIGIHRTRGEGPPLRQHLEVRFQEMRACLRLGDAS